LARLNANTINEIAAALRKKLEDGASDEEMQRR
jgi:hypothetical protein